MRSIKTVSFDVTGTLVGGVSVKRFWDAIIPMTYAKENNISFEEAFSYVSRKYRMLSPNDIRWYLPEYWLDELKIRRNLAEMLDELKTDVKVFPEVESILNKLRSDYGLIVSSNLPRKILDITLGNLKKYFFGIFSSISTYSIPFKNAEFYSKVCSDIGLKPAEVLHVGDNKIYDLMVPRVIGMKSLLVNRYRDLRQDYEVKDLEQVLDKLRTYFT
ncbi:MAG: HAD family hydrolase [Thermoproteota archaeon]